MGWTFPLTEIRDLLKKENEETSKTNTLIIDFTLLGLIIAIIALTISYFQSLSTIENVIALTANQTMFPMSYNDQIKYFYGVYNFQFGIAFIAIIFIIIGIYRIYLWKKSLQ